MPSNINEFMIKLKGLGDATERHVMLYRKRVALDVFSRVILDTPVLSGRARGNWFASLDIPDEHVDLNLFDKSGATTVQNMIRVVNAASSEPFGIIWLTNNLPYILRLENGWSKKAPQGMVQRAITAVMSGLK